VYIETRYETDGVSWTDVRRTSLVHFSVNRRAEVVVRYRPVGGTQDEVAEVLKNGGEVDETMQNIIISV